MGRWEPNARERLQRAALDLFLQQGYDATTATQIAARAKLAKSSFFRHFADKREVLFGKQDELQRLFADAIVEAGADAGPLDAVGAALDAAATVFIPERREWSQQRQVVIDAHSELRERELLKLASVTSAMSDALRKRGVSDPAAGIVAELGSLAFRNSFSRWIDPAEERGFGEIARTELRELRTATAALR